MFTKNFSTKFFKNLCASPILLFFLFFSIFLIAGYGIIENNVVYGQASCDPEPVPEGCTTAEPSFGCPIGYPATCGLIITGPTVNPLFCAVRTVCCPTASCGSPEPYCGDGSCNNGENITSCAQDCTPPPYCGDGICNNGETSASCFTDCDEAAPMSGTLTPATPSCVIASGASSCTINHSWTTTNPVATSSVTSNTNNSGASAPGTVVANGNNGGPTAFTIPYGGRTFYLYNNSQLLATSAVASGSVTCASGTSWNGSICAATLVNNAQCNNITVSPSSTLNPGQPFTATITMGNTGSTVWSPNDMRSDKDGINNYHLTVFPWAATPWNYARAPVTTNVANDQNFTFTLSMTAPSTPGTYTLGTEMLQEGVEWFGSLCSSSITVTEPPPVVTISPSATSVVVGQTVTFTVSATSGSGLAAIGIESTNSGGTPIANLGETVVSGNSASGNFPWTPSATGTFYFDGYAWNSTRTLLTRTSPITTITVTAAPTAPTVTTTTPVTSITPTTATGGGNITSNGGATVTVSGIAWSTSVNPTTALSTKTTNGWAIGGPWTSGMTGLTPSTLYHVRAYATNSVGTAYGSDVTFTTSAIPPPTNFVSSCSASGTSASLSWTLPSGYTLSYFRVTDDTAGGTNPGYWIPENVSDTGPATSFATIAGHSYSTWVHTRISNGEYSTPVYSYFTCPNATPISISNLSAYRSSITNYPTLSDNSIYWTTTGNPTSCVASGSSPWGNGSGTTAVNASIATGNQYQGVYPSTGTYTYTLTCSKAGTSNATATITVPVSATMSGTLTPASPSCTIASGASSCNVTLTWSTTNPQGTSSVTASGMTSVSGNSGSQAFAVPYSSRTFYLYNNAVLLATSNATSACTSGTTWNGSTCATNTVPTVITTTPVTSVTSTTATGGGNITSNGGSTVTVSGITWSTSVNPTTALSTKTTNGWAIGGPWTSGMTGLTPSTLYHVRAYATNSVGTAYGADVTFTTSAVVTNKVIGKVCKDDNGNGVCDVGAGEGYIRDISIGVCPTNPGTQSPQSGFSVAYSGTQSGSRLLNVCSSSTGDPIYEVLSLPDGSYTVTLTKPAGWAYTGCTVNVSTNCASTSSGTVSVSAGSTGIIMFTVVPSVATSCPSGNAFIASKTLSTLRNDWGGWFGAKIVIGSSDIVVSALGRIRVAGNTGTHTVKLVKGADGLDVPGGSVSINMSSGTVDQYKYATLGTPVTLLANNTYYIVSQEVNGGDFWYRANGISTIPTSVGTIEGPENNDAGTWNFVPGQPNQMYIPLDMCTSSGMSGTLNPTSSSTCTISSGASSCTINHNWTTTNPVATSAVTSDINNSGASSPNFTVASGNNGTSVAFTIPYGGRTFYLYNNAQLLATSSVSAGSVTCVSGTSWIVSSSSCAPSGPSAPVITISTNPTTMPAPGSTTVTWSATNNPTSCTASGGYGSTWTGDKPSSGSLNVSAYPAGSYAFWLSCTNGATGTNGAFFDVTPAGGGIIFTADPTTIYSGSSTTLTWSSSVSCSSTNSNFSTGGATSGNVSVTPAVTTTYTIDCGGTQSSLTVIVKRKPIIIEN